MSRIILVRRSGVHNSLLRPPALIYFHKSVCISLRYAEIVSELARVRATRRASRQNGITNCKVPESCRFTCRKAVQLVRTRPDMNHNCIEIAISNARVCSAMITFMGFIARCNIISCQFHKTYKTREQNEESNK
ncbi:hypothetical protein K1T71_001588 [Dendrolimus kikuchii]|uniref:Uncharacterized protein n=1 Tax=Dendrolimus kikuchii TaxID=765133 RepID=A0ACC1DE46_9NEOP|nr:hypothetical protein K1T71_001588 [Dendrolimus kikuchii]